MARAIIPDRHSLHNACANPNSDRLMLRLYLLYAFSGFLGLGYQVAWFRFFVDTFGSTNVTFAFVLVNFIGGLGAGSLASRRLGGFLGKRFGAGDPLRIYGLCEMGVAGTASLTLLLPFLPADLWGTFPYVAENGVHRPVALSQYGQLGISWLCVFVPCFLMGVTFPLLCSAFRDGPAT